MIGLTIQKPPFLKRKYYWLLKRLDGLSDILTPMLRGRIVAAFWIIKY
jgi:hypothetical protein